MDAELSTFMTSFLASTKTMTSDFWLNKKNKQQKKEILYSSDWQAPLDGGVDSLKSFPGFTKCRFAFPLSDGFNILMNILHYINHFC